MKKLTFFILSIFFFSCQNNGYDSSFSEKAMVRESSPSTDEGFEMMKEEYADYEEYESTAEQGNSNANGQSRQVAAPTERKIIRTANFRMQVDNVEKSAAVVESIVKQKGGFISSVNMHTSGSYINNTISIRIPNERLDSLIDLISKEAIHIDYKRIKADDVTEEFVDIQIRLKTKKEVRDRYIEVLKNKAKTVEEILNAEERIRHIQEEIESKEGRLRYLSNQASLSTINLELYQHDGKGIVRASYFSKLGRAFVSGWDGIKQFALGLVSVWPFLILLGIVIYWILRILKKREKA